MTPEYVEGKSRRSQEGNLLISLLILTTAFLASTAEATVGLTEIAGKDGELNTDDVNAQDAPPIQVGDLVDNLPEDYRKINLNGEKYYVTPSGYYLQDAVDENGKKVYKIISVPAPDADEDKK